MIKETLTSKIAVRLKPDEKYRLQSNAKLANLSVSELVRRQYFGYEIMPQNDEQLVNELRRIGGLLKHIHNQTGGANSQLSAQALTTLIGCIKKIATKNDS